MNQYISMVALTAVVVFSGCSFQPVEGDKPQNIITEEAPRIVNIINFIRQTEPRVEEYTDEVLYQTVVEQVKMLNQYQLKGTFLLQYDALINPKYQELLKDELYPGSEVGAWWEITQPHVEAAGMQWRGEYPWDWHANVGFATGYTPEEREKLVDVYMEKFLEVFGKYPVSVGSWFIDAHSLGYMYDKYHIQASCTCKDQVGTDGYTMWGGYWGQGYYPSRKNAFMPAQTREGQIPVPVFRMLGSDPIYQYDNALGGQTQGVVSLESVYNEGGGSQQWVEWFFEKMFEDPCLGFTYTQAGQENSFTWGRMQKGFQIQIPRITELSQQHQIALQTLGETGMWYKDRYPVTPATALSALSDYQDHQRKTVWFDSRFYRANLLWESNSFRIRDIHLFNEAYASDYLDKAGTSTQSIYTTLPLVDGCLWSTAEKLAGLRLYSEGADGQWIELKGGTPWVRDEGKTLQVTWCVENEGRNVFIFTFAEDKMEVVCKTSDENFHWNMELKTKVDAELPFETIQPDKILATQKDFHYQVLCEQGSFSDCRAEGQDSVFRITPSNNRIVLAMDK